jgi:hypothetical protein
VGVPPTRGGLWRENAPTFSVISVISCIYVNIIYWTLFINKPACAHAHSHYFPKYIYICEHNERYKKVNLKLNGNLQADELSPFSVIA